MGWRKVEIANGILEPTRSSGWWRLGASLTTSRTVLLPTLCRRIILLLEAEIAPWDKAARLCLASLAPRRRLRTAEHLPPRAMGLKGSLRQHCGCDLQCKHQHRIKFSPLVRMLSVEMLPIDLQ